MTNGISIGAVELLEDAPTTVTIEGSRYILHEDDTGDPILYSAVCPHQHGRVKVIDESTFLCPNHRWEFDADTGVCVSGGDGSLEAYDVIAVDGELRAVVD